jgi:hypothetical protein
LGFLSKTLLVVGATLLAIKFFSRGGLRSFANASRWRALGRRLDRAVNLVLVLLGVTYALYAIWWAWKQ